MRKRIIRIFISSVFREFEAERDILAEQVFPELEKLCREHAFSFQTIDLRWGVSEQDALDNQTVDICFEEIRRCQYLSPRPNFIIMAGSRYGWRPLPGSIEEEEWELLTEGLDDGRRLLLEEWYRQDENDMLRRYRLQPREGKWVNPEAWSQKEQELSRCLFPLAKERLKKEEQLLKFGRSATEQEIYHGFFEVPQAKEHTFIMIKEPLPAGRDRFRDSQSAADTASADDLREHLLRSVSGGAAEAGPAPSQLCVYRENEKTYVKAIREFLTALIKKEIAKAGVVQSRNEQADICAARREMLAEIENQYINVRGQLDLDFDSFCEKNRGKAILVPGRSGSGKSYFLKHWVWEHRDRAAGFFSVDDPYSDGILEALRYCADCLWEAGSTAEREAVNGRTELPAYADSEAWILNLLGDIRTPDGRTAVIVLDGLEDFSDWNRLPFNLFQLTLPENVVVAVSCAVEPHAAIAGIPANTPTFPIRQMGKSTAREMIRQMLARKNRLLREGQYDLLESFLPADCTPLYISILAEFCEDWKSFRDPGTKKSQWKNPYWLSPYVLRSQKDIVRAWLDELAKHGYEILYWHTLIYLSLARDGLTEQEVLDLLSLDPDVLEDIRFETEQNSAKWTFTRVPPVLWAKIYNRIRGNLREQLQNEHLLMKFRHRSFAEQIASQTDRERKRLAVKMRDYFYGLPWDVVSDAEENTGARQVLYNRRKIRELYHLNQFLGDIEAMRGLYEEPRYIDGCIRLGMYRELVTQLTDFLEVPGAATEYLRQLLRMLWSREMLFEAFPDSYLQTARAFGLARNDELRHVGKKCFLEPETGKTGSADAHIFPMKVTGNEFAVSASRILAVCAGSVLRLYDMRTRMPLETNVQTGMDSAVPYWDGEDLVLRGEYARIRYRFSGRRLTELSREDCPGWTHLSVGDRQFEEAGGWGEEALYFNSPKIYDGRLHYVDGSCMREEAFPIREQGELALDNRGPLLAILHDSSFLQICDVRRREVLSEYHYLMIERVIFAQSGTEVLLVLTNGMIALVPVVNEARGNPMRIPPDRTQPQLVLDTVFAGESPAAVFSEISLPWKGDYPYQSGSQHAQRKPLFAAFSETAGWVAAYYRYNGENIVKVWNFGGKATTYLVDPIYQKDAVNAPFFASKDGSRLVLVSRGRYHVFDVRKKTWKKMRTFEEEEAGGLSEELRAEYIARIDPWLPKKREAVKPFTKAPITWKHPLEKFLDVFTRALSVPLAAMIGYRKKAHMNQEKRVELEMERLATLKPVRSGRFYWLVDREYGIIQVFDERGVCLCREQTGEKVLAYEICGNRLTFLIDGTFEVRRMRLREV